MRHRGGVGLRFRVAPVRELDLDRHHRGLHAVDDIGERGRSGGRLGRRRDGERRREGAALERDATDRGEGDRAEQRLSQAVFAQG